MTNKTNFVGFLKTAASTVGPSVMSVPAKMASDAYELYVSIPQEDGVKVAYAMYRDVKPGFNKIAMEMVAANILADLDSVDVTKISSDVKKNSDDELTPTQEKVLDTLKQGMNAYQATYNDLRMRTLPNNMYRQGFNSI